jgi:hypothetical protein
MVEPGQVLAAEILVQDCAEFLKRDTLFGGLAKHGQHPPTIVSIGAFVPVVGLRGARQAA